MRNGDWITRLSFLIMGFGNIVRKQFVKGLSFLVLESIFIYFMIKNGASLLTDFFHLGGAEQEKVWNDAKGIFEYTQGDNSLLMLLYGVATVFIIFAFVCLWVVSVESAYRAQCLHDAGKKVPGFTDDIKSLFDKNLHMFLLPLPVLGIKIQNLGKVFQSYPVKQYRMGIQLTVICKCHTDHEYERQDRKDNNPEYRKYILVRSRMDAGMGGCCDIYQLYLRYDPCNGHQSKGNKM